MSATPTQMQIMPPHEVLPASYPSPNLAICFLIPPLMAFFPRTFGRRIVGVPIWKAAVVGLFYFLLTIPYLKIVAADEVIRNIFLGLPMMVFINSLILIVIMQWLAMLPFAARPGSVRAALIHNTRNVLFMLVWLPMIAVILNEYGQHAMAHFRSSYIFDIIATGTSLALSLVALWTISLARSLGVEYRTPADRSKPHDPTCDECGYNLTMSPTDGCCPECGKPVADSLSAATRRPSAWEQNPSLINPLRVMRQLFVVALSPFRYFSSIPLTTDHRAARRWLIFSLVLIGLCAAMLGPVLSYLPPLLLPLLHTQNQLAWPPELTFANRQLYLVSFAIGMTWALLALMMVGIETGGMAIVSHVRQTPVDLAAAAKVTCYASTFMLPWVFIGSIQILGTYLWTFDKTYLVATERVKEVVAFGSGAVFHIAGLVIFEFIVYRGLRRIQYANK